MLPVMHGAWIVVVQNDRFPTDRRGLLLALKGHRVKSRQVQDYHILINRVAEVNVEELCWVIGDEGNRNNEEADRHSHGALVIE